jgi:hypothetical protein
LLFIQSLPDAYYFSCFGSAPFNSKRTLFSDAVRGLRFRLPQALWGGLLAGAGYYWLHNVQ